jgi:protein O-GlcNAc transferase
MNKHSRATSLETALELYSRGKVRESELVLGRRLKLAPRDAEALHFYGVLLVQTGRPERAVEYLRKAVAENPKHAPLFTFYGEALRQVGLLEQAGEAQERAILLQPELVEAYLNLAMVQRELGNLGLAVHTLERAVALRPDAFGLQFHLADTLRQADEHERAAEHYRVALALNPESVPALSGLAETRFALGRFEEAVEVSTRALALEPDSVALRVGLAEIFFILKRYDEAVELANQACGLDVNCGAAYKWRGMALLPLERYGEAARDLKRACELLPESNVALTHYISVAFFTGAIEDAVGFAKRALAVKPSPELHGNLVFNSAFHPGFTQPQILEEARAWAKRYADPVFKGAPAWPNPRVKDRRLRVGYVSPNYWAHVLSLYFVPLFSAHDRTQVEVIAYSTGDRADAVTDRIRGCVDVWHDVAALDDAALNERIRRDQIDVLVDATMHMTGSRLPVFAARAAPVQLCWLAYPGTTGLSQIDYRITDRYLDPPRLGPVVIDEPVLEVRDEYSEASLILPDTFWCYDPLTQQAQVGPLPALARGVVTFGCLNNPAKVNEAVLKLWAKVLLQVEGSRLLLLVHPGPPRDRVIALFAAAGVAADRLELVPTQPREAYLATYNRMDICLDTFPYNGHTVSLDSFWMGVPVVTLVGTTLVGRAGFCQASNLGLPQLIAYSEEEFVEKATALARDLESLARLRGGLRERMQRSPLMDASRFAGNMEAAYRLAWHRWCE